LNARRVEIRAAVVAAFFDALAAQDRTALAQDSVDLARKATDAVAKRVMAGKVSPVEETKARVAEAGVRVELAQAQSEQRSARARLASLLGASPPQFTQVSGSVDDLPVVPSLDDIQQRLSASSALRRAQLEVERRRSLADVERSKQTPDVTVSLGVKRPNELARNQLMLGVSVPLPLFDRNQGNLLEALKREDKARDELQALNLRLSTEVLQARERLTLVRGEIDVLQREVLPGAKSAYDAATVGFGYGKFNFLEVLDAQRTYFAAQSQYLKALAEAHRAAADMDRVIGASESTTTPPANKE
jgi:cobalt-zinc-cadmium efflux system outer membrane protein